MTRAALLASWTVPKAASSARIETEVPEAPVGDSWVGRARQIVSKPRENKTVTTSCRDLDGRILPMQLQVVDQT